MVVEMESRGEREVNLGDITKSREWQGQGYSLGSGWGGGKGGDDRAWRLWSVGRRGRRGR